DFGMIANDTGFAAAHSHCFRIRERLLRLNKRLTGNRLLRGALVPGGNMRDFPADLDLVSELETVLADFNQIVEITLSNTLVADRLEGTGCLTTQTARDHGVLGFVAPASGLDIDARPVVPELASAVIRSAQEHRSRLPALQQVVQSVLLGERPLAGIIHDRRTLCREALRPRQASHAGRRSGRDRPSGPRPLEYPRGRRAGLRGSTRTAFSAPVGS